MLRYFNFESSFKLRWCPAQDLFGSEIPVTTRGFELRISCICSSYLTQQAIRPKRLDGFGVPEFATLRQEQLIYVEILELQAKFQTVMALCLRFIWITNSSDHRRVLTANLLHTKQLPNLLDHKGLQVRWIWST